MGLRHIAQILLHASQRFVRSLKLKSDSAKAMTGIEVFLVPGTVILFGLFTAHELIVLGLSLWKGRESHSDSLAAFALCVLVMVVSIGTVGLVEMGERIRRR